MASSIPLPVASQPPQARRLNRNAAIVAGAVLLVTLLVVVFLLTNSPTREYDGRSGTAQSLPSRPGPAEPGFLDRPPGEVPIPPAIDARLARSLMPPAPAGYSADAEPYVGAAPYRSGGDPYAAQYTPPPQPPIPSTPSPREVAYQRALVADILVGSSDARAEAPAATAGQGTEARAAAEDPRSYAAASAMSPGDIHPGGMATGGVRSTSTPSSGRGLAPTALTYAVQPAPPSYHQAAPAAYTLFAGTVLPAMLITGINSDLAGDILAQISRDVYSSDQRALVIPKGSRLIGRYDDQIALGQNRLVVAWTRLLLPDGRSISFPGLPTQDPRGASGIRDRVDHHFIRTFGNAILLSAVGAGLQLSQPRQGSVFAGPSTGQVAAASAGQELSTVAIEAIRRNMNIKPTVTIRPGTPFVVFLNGDLELEPYRAYPAPSRAGQD